MHTGGQSVTVKEFKEQLEAYNEDAEVVVVDWANGTEYDPTIGGDDEDEFTEKCRIGF